MGIGRTRGRFRRFSLSSIQNGSVEGNDGWQRRTTVLNSAAAPPLSPRPRALNFLQKLMCEALLIAGDCGLPFASGPRKMADTVTTLEVR